MVPLRYEVGAPALKWGSCYGVTYRLAMCTGTRLALLALHTYVVQNKVVR